MGIAARHRVAGGQTAAGKPEIYPLRVLILEDRAADAELMVRELRKGQWNVQWQRVHTRSQFAANLDPLPDIILADYAVPGFDALDALTVLGERGLTLDGGCHGSYDCAYKVTAASEGIPRQIRKPRRRRNEPQDTA